MLVPGSGVGAVVVAPAHQYPLGVTLAPARRSQLLAWAAQDGGLIVEDDYDAEFRYDRQPVGALQGLAPEHVAYVGTVSKTLAPALRLGWMVLPGALAGPVTQARHRHDSGSPAIEQLALAHLLDSGSYERHLRRMRQRYRQRRDALLAALRHHLPAARIGGTADAAGQRDLALSALDHYLLPGSPASDNRLVLGYGNIAPAAIGPAAALLAQALAASA